MAGEKRMFITNKAAFGYKFLLSLILVGMFASNGNASTVVPVDWLNNTSLNITDLSSQNIYEYQSSHSAADPNIRSDRIRLDNAYNGYIMGTVTLPSYQDWQLNFYVVNDDGAGSDTAAEYVKLSFDGSLFSTVYNSTPDVATPISYDFTGDSFSFYFEFYSPIATRTRHLVVETATVTAVPLPPSGLLFLFSLPLLFWRTRRKVQEE